MKKILFSIVPLLLITATAQASGGFTCQTTDGSIAISGGDSSAGTWINTLIIDGVELEKDVSFTADMLFNGENSFNFRILDGDYNRKLLTVELVKSYPLAAGIAYAGEVYEDNDPMVMTCEFSY